MTYSFRVAITYGTNDSKMRMKVMINTIRYITHIFIFRKNYYVFIYLHATDSLYLPVDCLFSLSRSSLPRHNGITKKILLAVSKLSWSLRIFGWSSKAIMEISCLTIFRLSSDMFPFSSVFSAYITFDALHRQAFTLPEEPSPSTIVSKIS